MGDVNKDGLDDIAIVMAFHDPIIVYGSKRGFPARTQTTRAADLGTTLFGSESETRLAGIGDFNGDGRGDVAFSAMRKNATIFGEAVSDYVSFGRKPNRFKMIAVPGLSVRDGLRLDLVERVGGREHIASAAGDINGDGLADIIIGTPEAGTGGKKMAGGAYVVFGTRASD